MIVVLMHTLLDHALTSNKGGLIMHNESDAISIYNFIAFSWGQMVSGPAVKDPLEDVEAL